MKFHIFTNKRFLKNEPFLNQVVIDKIGLSCSKGKDCKILSINFAIIISSGMQALTFGRSFSLLKNAFCKF